MKPVAKRHFGFVSTRRNTRARRITRLVVSGVLTLPGPQKFLIGKIRAGQVTLRCALGRNGIGHDKREGDHRTPSGTFRLLAGYYRSDRMPRCAAAFPMRPIGRLQGWCDDSHHALYNRSVWLPFGFSHETFWREDRAYDLLIVLDYNIDPRRKNRGSAIFLHCCREGFTPTEGCIALDPADLRRLLPRLSRDAVLIVR